MVVLIVLLILSSHVWLEEQNIYFQNRVYNYPLRFIMHYKTTHFISDSEGCCKM